MANESKPEPPFGYPLFAFRIAEDKDKFTTIYRRFERLAARNLLYFEAELCELEAKQDQLDEDVAKTKYYPLNFSGMNKLKFLAGSDLTTPPSDIPETSQVHNPTNLPIPSAATREGEEVRNERSAENPPSSIPETSQTHNQPDLPKPNRAREKALASERLEVAIDIRRTLREYYEALKLESDILALRKPARGTLEWLRKRFDGNPEDPDGRPPMIGEKMESHLHADDLCVLGPPVERDRLTKFFEGPFSQRSDIFRVRDSDGKYTNFLSSEKISNTVGFISIIAATAFLVAAIWALYAVPHPKYQLIMLTFFAICFAACIALLTNARRQDVFAVTAGYARFCLPLLYSSTDKVIDMLPSLSCSSARTWLVFGHLLREFLST